MYKVVGAVIGGLLGLLGPFVFAQIYVAFGGDPTAAGALFIVTFATVPLGIVIGGVIGSVIQIIVKRSKR